MKYVRDIGESHKHYVISKSVQQTQEGWVIIFKKLLAINIYKEQITVHLTHSLN